MEPDFLYKTWYNISPSFHFFQLTCLVSCSPYHILLHYKIFFHLCFYELINLRFVQTKRIVHIMKQNILFQSSEHTKQSTHFTYMCMSGYFMCYCSTVWQTLVHNSVPICEANASSYLT